MRHLRQQAAVLLDTERLRAQHWDEAQQAFADWGLDTSDVRLARASNNEVLFHACCEQLAQAQHDLQAVIDARGSILKACRLQIVRVNTGAPPRHRFVPHLGYNSLFPLALQLLRPGSAEFDATLRRLDDPQLLWTQYGLRSLAPSSSLYMKHNTPHDPPYWRGAVWINVNYLVLRSLWACARCGAWQHSHCTCARALAHAAIYIWFGGLCFATVALRRCALTLMAVAAERADHIASGAKICTAGCVVTCCRRWWGSTVSRAASSSGRITPTKTVWGRAHIRLAGLRWWR